MAEDHKVVWRAFLDIVNLRKNAKEAERDLKKLEDRERSVATSFADADRQISKSAESQSRSTSRMRSSMDRVAAGVSNLTRSQVSFKDALRQTVQQQESYNKLAAKTEDIHNKEVAAQARLNASKERFLIAQQKVADAQKKANDAEKAHADLLKKSTASVEDLTKANDLLERAQARVTTATAKEAEASSSVARAHQQHERAAKAAAKGNDDLAVSLERVRSKTIQLEKASNSRFGRNQQGLLTSLRNGYNSLGRAAGNFTDILLIKAPAAVAGLAAIGSALSALVAGATALVSALGPVVGILGAIPGAFAAGAVGIGSMIAAFKGVGTALKAYSKEQAAASKTAQADARAQQAAARGVRDAKRGVRDAYEQSARAAEAASQRITSAEKNLARSQKESRAAQADLNRARAEAIRQLEDMKKSVRDAGFSEEEATLALADAKKRLEATRTDANASSGDLARADLDYREALARLDDAQKAKTQAVKDNAEAQAKGVKGADVVIAAQDRVISSNENVVSSQQELDSARKDAARSARDSSEAIQRAIENQADAQQSLTDAIAKTSGAQSQYLAEMAKLSPAAQKFVKYLISLKGNLTTLQKSAQEGMLPGAQKGLESIMKLFPLINRTVGNTSKIIGDMFAGLGEKISSPANAAAIGRVFTTNEKTMRSFSRGVQSLAGYFIHVADAARPLTEWIGKMFEKWAKGREAVPTKQMETFFGKTQKVLGTLGRIFGNLFRGFKNVGKAGEDFGNHMLTAIEDVTNKWADWTGTLEGQNALKKWFSDAEPIVFALARLFRDIGKNILDLSTSQGLAPFIDMIRTQVLPNIKKVFDVLSKGGAIEKFGDFLVAISDALVKMAEGGALGGLTKALEFLTGIVDVGQKIFQIPGVGAILSTMAAGLFAFKGLKLAGQITGITNLYEGVKKLYTLGKGRKTGAKQIADDIASLAAATGQSPEQVAATYGVGVNGKKQKKPRGAGVTGIFSRGRKAPKPSATMNARAASTPRRSTTSSAAAAPKRGGRMGRMGGAAGGLGAVAGIAASFLPLDGILATVVPILASLAGVILPALGAAFAAISAPVLIVVGVIAAIGAGLVLLFNKNKTFHDFVINSWENIKKFIASAWNDYIFPVLQAFGGFFTDTLGPAISDFWNNVISPAFSAIGSIISYAWNNVIQPVLSAFWGFISEFLAPIFLWFWRTVISGVFKGVSDIISFAWNNVIRPVFKAIWGFLSETLGPVFQWLYKNIIKPVWDSIGTAISTAWGGIKSVFGFIKSGIEGVGSVFKSVRDGIVGIWDNITGALSGPVQSALQWIQEHMINPINSFLKGIGISWQIGAIWTKPRPENVGTGMVNAGREKVTKFASGGSVGGSSPHDRADNIPAMLTAGEFVLPVRAVRAISAAAGPGYLENLRQGNIADKRRRYAAGGFVRPVTGNPSFPWGHYPSGGVHRALDIPARVGTPVVSAENGSILRAGWDRTGFGNHIRLAYNNGTYMILGHLSRIVAKEGQKVRAGQLVGYSGNTGNSTGPHVHVEMRTSPYDPSSAYNFSNSWYKGDVPPFTKAVRQDTLLSNIALGAYDMFTGPVKAGMNATLPKLGLPGNFMYGAGMKIIEGVRSKIADWTQTTAYVPDAGSLNAPRDHISSTTPPRSYRTGEVLGLATGGRVPGTGNKDTVPAMLTPGEFVVRKQAVRSIGLDALHALNGGGDGGPSQYRNGIGYFNVGGPVISKGGTKVIQGGSYPFINLIRMLQGNGGWNSLGTTKGLWDDKVTKSLRGHKGIIPNVKQMLNPDLSAGFVKWMAQIVNSGRNGQSLWEVAGRTHLRPLTVALSANKYRKSLVKMIDPKKGKNFWKVRDQVAGVYSKQVQNAAGYMSRGDKSWNGAFQTALQHMMYHGMKPQFPHGDNLPTPWPLTGVQTAIQQQNANNALTTEFNRALDTLSTWGYGYLVDKLQGMGATDGIGLAREAVKSRTLAASYNASLERAAGIAATSDSQSYKFVSFLNANGNPGIRNSARELGVPEYSVVEMWDKLVKANRINSNLAKFGTMKREIDMYRKGVFYAATGGQVPGTGTGDTVPAMLTPGEFVLRKTAVRALGIDNLRALNNVQHFADGGPVYSPQVAGLPPLRNGSMGLANRLASAGQGLTTVNITTTINNPVAEPSTASFNKNLRRQSAVGAFGTNGVIGKDVTNG